MNRTTKIREKLKSDGESGVRELILDAYRDNGGVAERAAETLDVSDVQLRRWVNKLKLVAAVAEIRRALAISAVDSLA